MTWKRYWNPEEMLEAGDGSPVAAHHPRIPRTAVILRYILYEHRNGKDRAGRHENCRQDERIFLTHSNGGEGDGHRRGSRFITGVALTAVIISFLLLAAHFRRMSRSRGRSKDQVTNRRLNVRRKWAARRRKEMMTVVVATPARNREPPWCPSPSPPLLCVTNILSSCLQFSCRPARSLPFRCSWRI